MISPSQEGEIFVWPFEKPPTDESGIFSDKHSRNDYWEVFWHPSKSRSSNINLQKESERCVIAQFAPKCIFEEYKQKVKENDKTKVIRRVIITINYEGGLAVLIDLESKDPSHQVSEEDDLGGIRDENVV